MINNEYSEDEKAFIRANYLSMRYQDIADHCGRSLSSIKNQVHKLGLRKKERAKPAIHDKRFCAYCSVEFVPNQHNQKYCSKSHRRAAIRKQSTSKEAARFKRWYEAHRSVRIAQVMAYKRRKAIERKEAVRLIE